MVLGLIWFYVLLKLSLYDDMLMIKGDINLTLKLICIITTNMWFCNVWHHDLLWK